MTEQKAGLGRRILVWTAIAVGAFSLIEFTFYGREAKDLLAGAGFALLAYGIRRNGLSGAAGRHAIGRYAAIAGTVLIVFALALRFLR